MNSVFVPADREALSRRLADLDPTSSRQWGRMEPGQMLRHCAIALEMAVGEEVRKQVFLGKLLMPFIRRSIFGPKPWRRNSPTDPSLVVSQPCEFEAERTRLATLLDRFIRQGPEQAARHIHPFFGRLSGEEWGRLMYKHLDHHLQQFGV
jgi:hypothetical protein